MAENTVIRNYSGSDANLLQAANLNKNLLQANLADFTAEDPSIDAAYVTAYATDIAEAEETVSDEQVAAILEGKTNLVKLAAKAVAGKVKQVSYYVKEAFPTDKAVHHEFGLDRWNTARNSQEGTLRFLTGLHQTAQKYQAQLTAKGFGPTRTAAIDTARQAMEDADDDQEQYRRGRPKLSALRITEFNEVYARMTRINALAQIVYANDPEMASQFVFNPSSGNTLDGPGDYEGNMAAGEAVQAARVAYDAARQLTFANTGNTELQFYLSNSSSFAAEGVVVDVLPSGVTITEMGDLDASANRIVVKNMSDDNDGSYKVTVGSI